MNLQPHSEGANVSDALSQILTDSRKLMFQEMDLAKANLMEHAYQAQTKIALTSAGIWFMMVGAALLGIALVRLLEASGISPWLSCAIVSGVYFGVGLPLFVWGKPFHSCAIPPAKTDEITQRRTKNESGS